mgnify:CR=1 FL=1
MNDFDWRGALALALLAWVVTSLFLGLGWGLIVIAMQDYHARKQLEQERHDLAGKE